MTGLKTPRALGILAFRLTIGWVFLFAGIEKLFLSGHAFDASKFLQFGTLGTAAGAAEGAIVNPTHAFWVDLATNGTAMNIVNFLVPFGQVAIGLALILGLATRFAGLMGALMMAFIGLASWDFANGIVNYHFVLMLSSLILAVIAAGEVYGVDAVVDEQPIVKRAPALRYVLG
jgi:thiosulfate dehydrogenase [quinone] large subunit